MSERDGDHFDIDDDFLAEQEEPQEFDRLLDRVDRRVKPTGKRGRLEDVLAERKLEKELREFYEEDK